jgi:DNA-binding NarL/FixJ family response regulator
MSTSHALIETRRGHAGMSILKLRALAAEPLLCDEEWQAISCELKLSGREIDILRCVVEDEKESAIAQRLAISVHTVHTHLHRLYRKLGVSSRLDVIVLIFRECMAHTRRGRLAPRHLERSPSDRAAA